MLLLRFIRRHFYIYLLFVLFAIFLLWIRKGSQIAKLEIEVAVVTVLKDDSNIEEYRLAMQTLECYCIQHRYAWIVIDVSLNETLKLLCPQDQFFFQRHCVTAQFLQENNYDYILFVDSDMGVINPKRRIEEYIMNDKDIIFYNRIWNFEVMAGSFLAKKTKFVIDFLRMWANYNYRLPHSFHGSDNAAIHAVLLHIASISVKHCEPLWNKSKSYTDVFIFEVCVRAQLEENEVWKKKIVVLPKGQSWARDGWLTDSKWSQQDFILHGWQKWRLNTHTFASWQLPLLSTQFNMSLCGTDNYLQNWKYNLSFARNVSEIRTQLNVIITLKESEYRRQKQHAEEVLANLTKTETNCNDSLINSSTIMLMNKKEKRLNLN